MHFNALFLSALVCVFVAPALAIHRDEAYQIDYQHALLGAPLRDNTFFHRPSTNSKATLLYTLSEKLVLGAVNPKDGALVWRQDLAEGASSRTALRGFLRAANETNMVISAVGNKVRAWEGADGRLVWEWEGKGSLRSLSLQDVAGGSKDPMVVYEDEGTVTISKLSSTTGKMKWEVKQDK